MAVMEEALVAWLLTKTAITDLIGTGSSARLWPDILDDGWDERTTGAAATYEIISSTDEHTLSDRAGFTSSRVQIVCYAGTRKAANALARAIKNSGVTTLKGSSGGVWFCSVRVEDGLRHDVEAPSDSTGRYRYIAEFDLMVDYLEE